MEYYKVPKHKIDRLFKAAETVDTWEGNNSLSNFVKNCLGSVDEFEIVEAPYYTKPEAPK